MRVSTILLVTVAAILARPNAVSATSALGFATAPLDRAQANDVVRKSNGQRLLRSRDTVDKGQDNELDDGSDDEERGITGVGTKLDTIVTKSMTFDDIAVKAAALTKGKDLDDLAHMSLGITKTNVKLFRQMERQGYTPTSLAEKIAKSPDEFTLNQKEIDYAMEAFSEYWKFYPRLATTST
ncbi:hypothetical protein PHYPSEUDO_009533 [Phytophthora pseudosyringae]|uniref:RxLR effector protein n=1 Tax=Phytophthora pseudosyringae TaxID=221518 RepID=A0A8T1VF27_9STRA|nr:hypothetical protein PHYPSEUDO_009533 [Phytophthora pseudosyringae]